jgi:malate synthase
MDYKELLTPGALDFISELHHMFDRKRQDLLRDRQTRQADIDSGQMPDYLEYTRQIREGEWKISPVPLGLQDRRVEITGPTDRKMVINALNSGARMFMADFEDANSPTWQNSLEGQINLRDALAKTITYTSPQGKEYSLNSYTATLLVRPRGLHLAEDHILINGEKVSAALFDFGLYMYTNWRTREPSPQQGPWFYLPKLESHREARWWNEVFNYTEDQFGLGRSDIRATVLIESILAVFEMDEILYELRDHAAGLNAGRWDYIFSYIKRLRAHPECVLPDRSQITMTTGFMNAYCKLLVYTCHKRGAHAMGGMAAFIPAKDEGVNRVAMDRVREDKAREAALGFDGTWIAHPYLREIAEEEFGHVLHDHPNQVSAIRPVSIAAAELLDGRIEGAVITRQGLLTNVEVSLEYIAKWLDGQGAVAIHNLMEDAATAEISRAQIWQWIHHKQETVEGDAITDDYVNAMIITAANGLGDVPHIERAKMILTDLCLKEEFSEFLTLTAYQELSKIHDHPAIRIRE